MADDKSIKCVFPHHCVCPMLAEYPTFAKGDDSSPNLITRSPDDGGPWELQVGSCVETRKDGGKPDKKKWWVRWKVVFFNNRLDDDDHDCLYFGRLIIRNQDKKKIYPADLKKDNPFAGGVDLNLCDKDNLPTAGPYDDDTAMKKEIVYEGVVTSESEITSATMEVEFRKAYNASDWKNDFHAGATIYKDCVGECSDRAGICSYEFSSNQYETPEDAGNCVPCNIESVVSETRGDLQHFKNDSFDACPWYKKDQFSFDARYTLTGPVCCDFDLQLGDGDLEIRTHAVEAGETLNIEKTYSEKEMADYTAKVNPQLLPFKIFLEESQEDVYFVNYRVVPPKENSAAAESYSSDY